MDWVQALEWFVIVVNVLVVLAVTYHHDKLRHQVEALHEHALVVSEMFELMERAHDSGRDVQDRIAAVIEWTLVVGPDEPPWPSHALLRAEAQARTALFMTACEQANLVIVPKESEHA